MSTPVSIILPTLNERRFIRDCLDSLLAQDYPAMGEILIVDGGSTDGTVELAEQFSGLVRVVPNPRVTAASAMNIGISVAQFDLIVRVDAHSLYAPDFVSRTVAALESFDAAVVGGPMNAVGLNRFGKAVAAVTSSPFGVGPGRFHYADRAQEVETVYLGAFRKDLVLRLGGYDEENLQWAAEDQELNYRIRKDGGRIWIDPAIRSWYFPRDTPKTLWRQYYNYGLCKASTLAKHQTLPYWRPLAPAGLVAAALVALTFGVVRHRALVGIAPVATWSLGAGALTTQLVRHPGVSPQETFLALMICHWAYGLGFWSGIWRIARRKPFENRPRGHR